MSAENTSLDRVNSIINSIDLGEYEHARASAEFLRGALENEHEYAITFGDGLARTVRAAGCALDSDESGHTLGYVLFDPNKQSVARVPFSDGLCIARVDRIV